MTAEEIIDAVNRWQRDASVPPLICGNDRTHRPLIALCVGGVAQLCCLDCDYSQSQIPDPVLRMHDAKRAASGTKSKS